MKRYYQRMVHSHPKFSVYLQNIFPILVKHYSLHNIIIITPPSCTNNKREHVREQSLTLFFFNYCAVKLLDWLRSAAQKGSNDC